MDSPVSTKTMNARLPADLAEMLKEIAWYERTTAAAIADAVLRAAIETRWLQLPKAFRGRRNQPATPAK